MNKSKKVLIGISVVLIISVFIFLYMAGIVGASPSPAYLSIQSGLVEVDQGKGWVKGIEGMELSKDDKIRTGPGAEATVIFYESALAELDENTEISITELEKDAVKIKQNSGSTWNKVTKLAGLENYEVETPTTVATVRGTEFGVADNIIVGEGIVEANMKGQKISLSEGEVSELVEGKLNKRNMSDEEIKKTLHKMEKMLEKMQKVRDRGINKIPIARMRLNKLTPEKRKDYEDMKRDIDSGEKDIDSFSEIIPIRTKRIDRAITQTTKIREQQQKIRKMRKLLTR